MNIGDICPEFEGINQFNQSVKSKELIGKKYLVIFFFTQKISPQGVLRKFVVLEIIMNSLKN